ncbi:TIGR03087 family PEP-CTERM/XrtA system glycosyltransferase [Azospirillum canadense]|uniref:TIGR03087 family PEP-CTERM/XrtA system glycosyltransferase n=1 Tax=Azospirillum canadense TaxID=403962 RepID=UPI00222742D8|nr:TIGR03087 family PEP-CTERM/XrtA system glycosyltransferase [Azospirillum canadense]MCW2240893.1 sugar transferase (PEP-CTERM/EpsH1 system associated) [Azospirillum canadense]
MREILFLAHRIPYPPHKGDKIRSWHVLKHVAERVPVHVGCFVDDPNDRQYIPVLERLCAGCHVVPLDRRRALLSSLAGFATGEALSVRYFQHRTMAEWVRKTLRDRPIDAVFAFSSQMFPYALDTSFSGTRVFDFVDVDSIKWAEYGRTGRWPKSWVYRREGVRLAQAERAAAAAADASLFVSNAEAALFRRMAPEAAHKVFAVPNGVDLEHFQPNTLNDGASASPYEPGGPVVVFVGAMDYWPNIDGVSWFVDRVWPAFRARHPSARFCIVGSNPTPRVRALGGAPGVTVTGRVPDVRPYLAHATVAVAPLRIARGIQNKVLEAMAMGMPVVSHPAAFEGLDAQPGHDLLLAETEDEFLGTLSRVMEDAALREALGRRARACVEAGYTWAGNLTTLDRLLGLERAPAARAEALEAGLESGRIA